VNTKSNPNKESKYEAFVKDNRSVGLGRLRGAFSRVRREECRKEIRRTYSPFILDISGTS
jgi:hypothetical protein